MAEPRNLRLISGANETVAAGQRELNDDERKALAPAVVDLIRLLRRNPAGFDVLVKVIENARVAADAGTFEDPC